jgi:hypothetical protein
MRIVDAVGAVQKKRRELAARGPFKVTRGANPNAFQYFPAVDVYTVDHGVNFGRRHLHPDRAFRRVQHRAADRAGLNRNGIVLFGPTIEQESARALLRYTAGIPRALWRPREDMPPIRSCLRVTVAHGPVRDPVLAPVG